MHRSEEADEHAKQTTSKRKIEWSWVATLAQYEADRKRLIDGKWLNSSLINSAKALIRRVYPHTHGLQDIQATTCTTLPDGFFFFQIWYVIKCHWLTVSTVSDFLTFALYYFPPIMYEQEVLNGVILYSETNWTKDRPDKYCIPCCTCTPRDKVIYFLGNVMYIHCMFSLSRCLIGIVNGHYTTAKDLCICTCNVIKKCIPRCYCDCNIKIFKNNALKL